VDNPARHRTFASNAIAYTADMRPEALVRVAVDRPLDQLFDYACPDEESLPVPGQRVRVTFGRSEQTGLVLETGQPPGVDRARIRPLDAVLDPEPILSGPILELLRFASRYYHHPIGETVLNALPPPLRKGLPLPLPAPPQKLAGAFVADVARPRLGPRQQAIVQGLRRPAQPLALDALCDLTGLALRRPELQRLADHGVVEAVLDDGRDATPRRPLCRTDPGPAGGRDRDRDRRSAAASVFLLDGVTGSGKTEVYLEAAAAAIARGLQVLILVPEIALTPQLVRRISLRFPGQVAALHSGLPAGERLRVWDAARRRRPGPAARHPVRAVHAVAEARPVDRRRGARPGLQATGRPALSRA
jgi:primosomal protein N' (replication factor Y) (superfamily II helicase)